MEGDNIDLLAELNRMGETIRLSLGEYVYSEGNDLDFAYMLVEGKIRLFHREQDEDQTFTIIDHEGDWIGLEGACLQSKALTSARSVNKSKLLKISNAYLNEIFAREPDLKEKLFSSARTFQEKRNSRGAFNGHGQESDKLSAAHQNDRQLGGDGSGQTPSASASTGTEGPEAEGGLITMVRRKFKLYPHVMQQSSMDCGVACLAMVMNFYGAKIGMKKLRELSGVSAQGTDLSALSETAEKLGFVTRGLKATYEGLLRARLPLVCHWDSNHFVVLYEINKESALLADPANDLVEISRNDFMRHFSMYALEISPSASLARPEREAFPLSRYAPLLAPHRKTILDILAASIAVQIFTLTIPLFTQVVVDKVLVHKTLSMLNMLLAGVTILILFQVLTASIRSYLVAFTAVKLDQSLFTGFFKHLLSLPLSFFEEHTTGDIISRLQENRKIQNFIAGSALTATVDLFMAAIYLILVFLYDWTFGAWTLVYTAIFSILLVLVTPFLRGVMRQVFQKQVASSAFSIEALRGIEQIKSAGAENRIRWHWEELFVDALHTHFKGTLLSRFTQIAAQFINLLGGVLLLWFGAHLVVQERLTIGQLMALIMIVGRITQPVLYLVDIWDEVQDLGVSFERLSEVLDTEAEENQPGSKLNVALNGNIEFTNVTFRYSGNQDSNAVQNLSFSVNAGETIGIVGRSGCGKSTLLKLLQGLYLPSEGRVKIDGHDVKHLSLRDMRKQFGVVSQQDYIFRGTIFDTIAFCDPEASIESVIGAAKLAGIHDFINTLPKSYQYEISEGGINLSGGQRQRLCIARALLHNPRIMLFDEATSFLDYDSERALQQSMHKIKAGRTLFIVAHRLSTVRDADRILVLDRGEIVESGNHDELMAARGLYYHLWSQATVS